MSLHSQEFFIKYVTTVMHHHFIDGFIGSLSIKNTFLWIILLIIVITVLPLKSEAEPHRGYCFLLYFILWVGVLFLNVCRSSWMCLVSVVSRRQRGSQWNYSYRWQWASTWLLEVKAGLFGEQQALLPAEQSLQPVFFYFLGGLENFIHDYDVLWSSTPNSPNYILHLATTINFALQMPSLFPAFACT